MASYQDFLFLIASSNRTCVIHAWRLLPPDSQPRMGRDSGKEIGSARWLTQTTKHQYTLCCWAGCYQRVVHPTDSSSMGSPKKPERETVSKAKLKWLEIAMSADQVTLYTSIIASAYALL